MSDPERLRRQHRLGVEKMRHEMRGDPGKEARDLAGKLAELELERKGYLRLSARGVLPDDELDAMLAYVDGQRGELEEALGWARNRHRSIEEAERAWEAVEVIMELDHISFVTASPEDRRRLYQALRLRVETDEEGAVTISGVFHPEIRLVDVLRDGPDVTTPRAAAGAHKGVVTLDNPSRPD